MFYFFNFDTNNNITNKLKTEYRYCFFDISNIELTEEEKEGLDADEIEALLEQKIEEEFQQHLSNNNIIEGNETLYQYENEYLKNNSGTIEYTSFENLTFDEQKEIAKKAMKENIKKYSAYLSLDDDIKTDILRLRSEIKNSTDSASLLTSLTELQTILSDLMDC